MHFEGLMFPHVVFVINEIHLYHPVIYLFNRFERKINLAQAIMK